jgi:non-heme chloroperoxidase
MPTTLAPDGVATARLPNGLHLQYRETGDRNGLPLILLHGVTDSLHSWKPFTDTLPSSLRTIAVSQRGHGDSSKPAGGYESAAFSADLAAFMDAIGVSSAHIIAHSMSTWIAQRFARDYADRIESLTLICGFVSLRGNPAAAQLSDALQEMGDTVDPAFVHDFQVSTVATGLPPDFLKLVIAESLKVPAYIWRATFNAMIVERQEKTSISHPTLLLSGGKDELFDDNDRKRLAAVFRSPRSIFYDALGHAPHWEEPHLIAKDVARFVTEMNAKSQIRRQAREG